MQHEEQILTPSAVDAVVKRCLFGEGRPTEDAIVVQGIVRSFGFDPDRVAESTAEIERLIGELPDDFLMSGGGGWTFLNMCQDRQGRQWTGSHATMEALCCIAIAAKRAAWLMPRDVWDVLPGGMPYIAFQTDSALHRKTA